MQHSPMKKRTAHRYGNSFQRRTPGSARGSRAVGSARTCGNARGSRGGDSVAALAGCIVCHRRDRRGRRRPLASFRFLARLRANRCEAVRRRGLHGHTLPPAVETSASVSRCTQCPAAMNMPGTHRRIYPPAVRGERPVPLYEARYPQSQSLLHSREGRCARMVS
jgi:hypothetical protein